MRAKQVWLEASCWVTKDTLAVAQNALAESAIGMMVDDGLGPDGIEKYPDGSILLKAYFPQDHGLQADIVERVDQFFAESGHSAPAFSFEDFPEDDWQANFVKSCTTFMVEPDIFIVPSFEIEEFTKNPRGPLYIEMDPENAFGTGHHQTTKLVLTAIREIISREVPEQALDVGCGSGILAILMKKLGAREVLATETDDDALTTAAKNARINAVEIVTELVDETHVYEQGRFDLIAANILAPTLIAMADCLTNSLAVNGHLILSGILLSQQNEVVAQYESMGLTLITTKKMDDWCALVFNNRC